MDALQEACSKRPRYNQYRETITRINNTDYTENLPGRARAKSTWLSSMSEAEALENQSPLPILISCTTTQEAIPGIPGISWVTTDYIYFLPELNATIIRSFPRERTKKDLLPNTVDLTAAPSFTKSTEKQIITKLELFTQRQLAGRRIETWPEFEIQLRKKFPPS